MDYAVFDWDYTLHRSYTLFTWIDFLCSERILSEQIQDALKEMQKKYDLGLISHDAYAEMACREYALAVKGLPAARLKEILPAYMEWDRQLLFPFTEGLFRYLKNRHIETVIITGAPGSVLEQYREYFGFKNIYAFEAEVHSGVYTGKIRCNHGSRKEGIMALLAKEYGSSPVFAFGDSSSDLPLLRAAEQAGCIGTSALAGCPEGTLYISPDTGPEELIARLQNPAGPPLP